ncbi:MAG TPA: hypothetical protein VFT86_11585 [Gaiellaceae bacterium]|nr:hypothetical protein [Gaiellaceae bacterium]
MNRIHALAASLIVALSAIFGLAAVVTTTGVGASKSTVSDQAISARQHELNRAEAALARARANKPPALPAIPATPRPRVVTQSAPSIVISSSSSDDEHEDDEDEHEEDDD